MANDIVDDREPMIRITGLTEGQLDELVYVATHLNEYLTEEKLSELIKMKID